MNLWLWGKFHQRLKEAFPPHSAGSRMYIPDFICQLLYDRDDYRRLQQNLADKGHRQLNFEKRRIFNSFRNFSILDVSGFSRFIRLVMDH